MLFLQSHCRSLLAGCLNMSMKNRSFHSISQPLFFQCSAALFGEPLRKKKRIDPSVLREKAEKKIRRLQRDIKRLEKVSRQFKPIAEFEIPRRVLRDSDRVRQPVALTEQEIQERAELRQTWAIYKRKQHLAELLAIQRIVNAQEKALDALQETSPELYEEALQIDLALIPFKMTGPVETPPIENFNYPDGNFTDVTKVYQPILPTDPVKQKKLGLHKKK